MRKPFVFAMTAALLLTAGTVYALPNVANTAQKGSLLFYPMIDVRAGYTTVVRLTNDGDSSVYVKCVYIDIYKHRAGLTIRLDPHEPIWIDVKNGTLADGSSVPQFPQFAGTYGAGEMICFAVNGVTEARQRVFNHLSGTATVFNFASGGGGRAWEYTAWAFYNRTANLQTAGLLELNGTFYDYCPQYLLGHFTPTPRVVTLAGGLANYTANYIAISGCSQDLTQDYDVVTTKLKFEIWNGNGVKFGEALACADSWHEMQLGVAPIFGPSPNHNADLFLYSQLGTQAAYYRVEGIHSSVCDDDPTFKAQFPGEVTEPVGIVGVQWTYITLDPGGAIAVGTNLNSAGTRAGFVKYVPGGPSPEGAVR